MRLNRQFIRTQLIAQNILSKNAPAKRENATENPAAVLEKAYSRLKSQSSTGESISSIILKPACRETAGRSAKCINQRMIEQ